MDGESWIRAAACGDLADGEALAVPAPDGRTIALFFTDSGYHAIDNQCPHMGFPLVRGLVRNGTVTCDWHRRSFDLAGGGCFHSQCDDVRVFETEIRDGSVWIRAEAEADDRREARLRLLWEGLLGDDRWTMSKAIAQLLHGGVPEADIVELVVRHVGRHIASSHDLDAGDDVSRLINGLKVGQRYEGEERLIALAIAARSAAGPAAERNENVPMPPPYDWERTARWVRSFSRDRMGNRIERCLYTAWTEGDGDLILPLLLECAVEPHFLDFGDSLISLAYLAELQDLAAEMQMGSALRGVLRYAGYASAAKAAYHAAWQFHSDRWLNIPNRPLSRARPLSQAALAEGDKTTDAEAERAAIVDAIESIRINDVGRLVVTHMAAGHPPGELLHEIALALLKHDTGWDTLDTLRTVFDETETCREHPAAHQLIVGLARFTTGARRSNNSDSATRTAKRFARRETAVDLY